MRLLSPSAAEDFVTDAGEQAPPQEDVLRHYTFENRSKLYACISTMMRRVIVDKIRKQYGRKSEQQRVFVSLGALQFVAVDPNVNLLRLEDALVKLEQQDAQCAAIIEQRIWGEMTIEETAAALGISEATVKRKYRFGKAFLKEELKLDAPTLAAEKKATP